MTTPIDPSADPAKVAASCEESELREAPKPGAVDQPGAGNGGGGSGRGVARGGGGGVEPEPSFSRTGRTWARFWVSWFMMWNLQRNPGLVRRTKPFFTTMAWRTSSSLRRSLLANARRILGDGAPIERQEALAKSVLANVYDFLCDIGDTPHLSDHELQGRVARVEGRDRYRQARSLKRGAILVTAHLGSFETAVAALRRDEPRVHIVFRRDPMERFERMRAAQRLRLGVIEAPVDDGLAVWVKLRDALLNDEVVLMQADRAMPGQTGHKVRFLHGHLLVPAGP